MELKIDSSNGFLNLNDLPHNCIFNKVITGCGGTTIALFNQENYVISVPTTELIINKTNKDEAGKSIITNFDGTCKQEVFGLFGAFTYYVKQELTQYLNTSGPKKIICTYDKLPRLVEFLNPSEFRLLVDEYHNLLKIYSYRNKAVDGIFESFRDYKSACFMSATPINPDFKPSALEELDEVNAKWDSTDKLQVLLQQTNKPYIKVANIINAYKMDGFIEVDGIKSKEAFFFLNSVTDIANILQYCNLADNEVKIVCADNEGNKAKLGGYSISNSKAPNKPFTFITSKSFEGADYFSEDGICFVVSNTHNPHTLEDISTDIVQIAGRIRTPSNPFRNMIIHIFNTSGRRNLNLDKTYQEMVDSINKEIEVNSKLVDVANSFEGEAREMASRAFNSTYICKDEDGRYFINDTLIKLELYEYNIQQFIYKNGLSLRKAYEGCGVDPSNIQWESIEDTITTASKKMCFKDAFLHYPSLLKPSVKPSEKTAFEECYPLVVEAYNKLGSSKVKSLKYIQKNVVAALESIDEEISKDSKIASILTKNLGIGFHSSKQIKTEIQRAFDSVGKKSKAKATEVLEWFDAKEVVRRIDGKNTKGYELYKPKINFRNE